MCAFWAFGAGVILSWGGWRFGGGGFGWWKSWNREVATQKWDPHTRICGGGSEKTPSALAREISIDFTTLFSGGEMGWKSGINRVWREMGNVEKVLKMRFWRCSIRPGNKGVGFDEKAGKKWFGGV